MSKRKGKKRSSELVDWQKNDNEEKEGPRAKRKCEFNAGQQEKGDFPARPDDIVNWV